MSLADTVQGARKYIIAFVVFVVLVVVIQQGLSIIGRSNARRTPVVLPNTGQVISAANAPDISSGAINLTNKPEYRVSTEFTDIRVAEVNAIRIAEPRVKLPSDDKAIEVAGRLGFEQQPVRSDEKLTWQEGSKSMEYWRILDRWIYSDSSIKPTENTVFSGRPSSYIDQAESLFDRLGISSSYLDFNTLEVDYLVEKDGQFVSANSPRSTQFIKLRVYRKFNPVPGGGQENNSTNELALRSIRESWFKAPLEIVLTTNSSSRLDERLIKSLEYTNWEFVDDGSKVPVLSPAQAWEKIKTGSGALKELTEIGFNRYEQSRISSRNVQSFTADPKGVEIAYLEPESWRDYMLPVYVFRGRARAVGTASTSAQDNADFVYYVLAVDYDKIKL